MQSINQSILLLTLLPLSLSAQSIISGLYDTGVDDLGNSLIPGHADPHYQLVSSSDYSDLDPNDLQSFATYGDGAWMSSFHDSDTSSWISPFVDSQEFFTIPILWWEINFPNGNFGQIETATPGATFTYSLSFYIDTPGPITDFDINISGLWASDNEGFMYLNGNDEEHMISATHTGGESYQTPTSFYLNPSLLTSGQNTLFFEVTNDTQSYSDNPSGLKVDFLSATATAVPEPTTYTFVLGLIACALTILYKSHDKKTGQRLIPLRITQGSTRTITR